MHPNRIEYIYIDKFIFQFIWRKLCNHRKIFLALLVLVLRYQTRKNYYFKPILQEKNASLSNLKLYPKPTRNHLSLKFQLFRLGQNVFNLRWMVFINCLTNCHATLRPKKGKMCTFSASILPKKIEAVPTSVPQQYLSNPWGLPLRTIRKSSNP